MAQAGFATEENAMAFYHFAAQSLASVEGE